MQQNTNPPIDNGLVAAQQAMQDTAFARSPAWQRVEPAFLAQQGHDTCAACHRDKNQAKLEVHHILPFHLVRNFQRPDLEFDPTNLVTLCDIHHLYIGHLGVWGSYNENVLFDVKPGTNNPDWSTYFDKQSFEADPTWSTASKSKPGPLRDWKPPFPQQFTDLMDKWHSPPPQEPLSVLIQKWYGLKISEAEIEGSINVG